MKKLALGLMIILVMSSSVAPVQAMEQVDLTDSTDNTSQTVAPALAAVETSIIYLTRFSATDGNEWVQIYNSSDSDIDVQSLSLNFINSSGIDAGNVFLENGVFKAKSYILLAQNLPRADASFPLTTSGTPKNMIPKSSGALRILLNDEVVSGICWGTVKNCDNHAGGNWPDGGGAVNVCWQLNQTTDYSADCSFADFVTQTNFSEFDLANLESGGWLQKYLPCEYNSAVLENDPACAPPCEFNASILSTDANCHSPVNNCDGLILSEIGANLTTQFIEVQNSGNNDLDISGCRIMTNRSTTKFYEFPSSTTLGTGDFLAINISDTNLTLTKTTTGTAYLLNSDGSREIDNVSYTNLKADTSWSLVGDVWQQTYAVTPNAANEYLQFPPCNDGYFRNLETGKCNKNPVETILADCGDGYFRNPDTGRCKKLTVETALAPCPEGQFRNPDTNRCKKIDSGSTLTPCQEGYERNPDTNRCRKIGSETSTLQPCADGYERNPDTNRCRKIVDSSAATFAVKNDSAGGVSGMWRWAAVGVLALILLVILWQYRVEFGRFWQKIFRRKVRLLNEEAAE